MNKDILLIEPNYRNKYPPLGLMKISAYHKLKEDDVTFYKGCSRKLQERRWDRIYVTTLFSFYWKKTIKTIQFYKRSVKKVKHFYVGGILATTMFNELIEETGIVPIKGLLDKPDSLGKRDDIIIDELTPDYDILDTIDYVYPTNNSYISYMTRGCCNKCAFCAVPKLEPGYNDYIPLEKQIKEIDSMYGKKHNLLLMDNNVLASKHFDQIVDEIIELGFEKGAKYKPPNLLIIYYNRFKKHYKDLDAERKTKKVLNQFKSRIKDETVLEEYENIINKFGLFDEENSKYGLYFSTKFKKAFSKLNPIYEKYRNKHSKNRYIDFNQGIDARLLTRKKMKRLSEINIRPLRIAFDDIGLQKIYEEKIRMAAEFDIRNLSNYVLYNFNDTPEDLYKRLKLNIDLNDELNLKIFSFPMKYIPINAKNRKYINKPNWNRKYLRTIQSILKVTHGAVMPRRDFFERAFGKNIEEFQELLLMPEDYIIYRDYAIEKGLTGNWQEKIKKIEEKANNRFEEALKYIYPNNFKNLPDLFLDNSVRDLLNHYSNRIKLQDYKDWKAKK